jgi:glycerol transport system ATP-binding protein
VRELAAKLHIEPFLERLPAELSGGQQQRVALARALAKNAPLMLLDEPLVNLDYKLREELREELAQLFAHGGSTVVLRHHRADRGAAARRLHRGARRRRAAPVRPTAEVFHRPASIRVARAFSDPPMNLVAAEASAGGVTLRRRTSRSSSPCRRPTPGSRRHPRRRLRVRARDGDLALPGKVELAEISGSDTFLHAETAIGELVAQLTGVHQFTLGEPVSLHLDPRQAYVFDAAGALLRAPARE